MGDYKVRFRVLDRKDPLNRQASLSARLGEPQEADGVKLVALQAADNLQSLGPGVLFQEVKGERPVGEAFWVLQRFPQFDFRRESPYAVVVDDVREVFFTGLQIGHDPGAPIYWLGCLGMLIGTFYALFVQHKKYYLRYERGQIDFTATIHRLPMGFEKGVARWADLFRSVLKPFTGESR
jgi:cytochrome c biogenesis protein ResB